MNHRSNPYCHRTSTVIILYVIVSSLEICASNFCCNYCNYCNCWFRYTKKDRSFALASVYYYVAN